ncbi:hypothetical protein LR48_Vigan02g088400 [Vigna angularis]|uniref:Uncharacterized protein n=1 Tax=Phaseolus angularis TaxID=3914 RepID=A0A0L9TX22_PHAAN|nr:hypothetical protein LR48_Vigan02g088400 [Vigna angularis]
MRKPKRDVCHLPQTTVPIVLQNSLYIGKLKREKNERKEGKNQRNQTLEASRITVSETHLYPFSLTASRLLNPWIHLSFPPIQAPLRLTCPKLSSLFW